MKKSLIIIFFLTFSIINAQTKKVAILDFENTSKKTEYDGLGKALCNMLITDLKNNIHPKKVQFYERGQLNKILDEQNLQKSKAFDKKTAVDFGKLSGSDYVFVGSLFVLEGTCNISSRLVDVQTSEIVLTKDVSGKIEDWLSLKSQLGEGIAQTMNQPLDLDGNYKTQKTNMVTLNQYAKLLTTMDAGDSDKAEQYRSLFEETNPEFKYFTDLKDDIEFLKKEIALLKVKVDDAVENPFAAAIDMMDRNEFGKALKYLDITQGRIQNDDKLKYNKELFLMLTKSMVYEEQEKYEQALEIQAKILERNKYFFLCQEHYLENLVRCDKAKEFIDKELDFVISKYSKFMDRKRMTEDSIFWYDQGVLISGYDMPGYSVEDTYLEHFTKEHLVDLITNLAQLFFDKNLHHFGFEYYDLLLDSNLKIIYDNIPTQAQVLSIKSKDENIAYNTGWQGKSRIELLQNTIEQYTEKCIVLNQINKGIDIAEKYMHCFVFKDDVFEDMLTLVPPYLNIILNYAVLLEMNGQLDKASETYCWINQRKEFVVKSSGRSSFKEIAKKTLHINVEQKRKEFGLVNEIDLDCANPSFRGLKDSIENQILQMMNGSVKYKPYQWNLVDKDFQDIYMTSSYQQKLYEEGKVLELPVEWIFDFMGKGKVIATNELGHKFSGELTYENHSGYVEINFETEFFPIFNSRGQPMSSFRFHVNPANKILVPDTKWLNDKKFPFIISDFNE